MDELDREIALQASRTALALSREIERLRGHGLLTNAQADRLIELLDSDDPEAAAQETARILAEAMDRARAADGRVA